MHAPARPLPRDTTVPRPIRDAFIAQLALAIYLQVIEWVPMPPWNDLSRGNGQERLDIALAIVMTGFLIGTWRRWRPVMIAAVIALAGWLWLQIQTWWIPYFTGGSAAWRRTYEVWFSRTLKFLPPIADHPVPDASHVVLHVLIVVALAATLRALLVRR